MATDLFSKYFSNATKSYIYSNLVCNKAGDADMIFTVSDGNAEITDGQKALSLINLSDVEVPCTSYTNEMRTLDPYEVMYVRGITSGAAYARKGYGIIPAELSDKADWQYHTAIRFHLKYLDSLGDKKIKCVTAVGSADDETTFVQSCQKLFDDNGITLNVTCGTNYIYFTSTVLGFEFWCVAIEIISLSDVPDASIDSSIHDDGSCGPRPPYPPCPGPFPPCPPCPPFPEVSLDSSTGFYVGDWDAAHRPGQPACDCSCNRHCDSSASLPYHVEDFIKTDWVNKVEDITAAVNADEFVCFSQTHFHLYLFEDLTKYIPAYKYKNGAMKGCVVKVVYPEYNADSIPDTMLSIRVAHIRDRVEDVYRERNCGDQLPLCIDVIRDVVDLYQTQYEYDLYKAWCKRYSNINYFDDWIGFNEFLPDIDVHWEHSDMPLMYALNRIYKDVNRYDAMGLYGYATWLTKHDAWMNMGDLYIRTATADDVTSYVKNLIPSFILYNPNPFPVVVKYMTFI